MIEIKKGTIKGILKIKNLGMKIQILLKNNKTKNYEPNNSW